MPLNSLDVQNKTFNTQFRGFNKQEVDEFLDIVVSDYDNFTQKIKEQELELKALKERVKYFDDMKESLNKSIIVAQDAADNLRLQAQNEASNILGEAGNKSQLIIEAAKKEAGVVLNYASDDARRLVRDTDDLKRKMRLYHQRMTSIIENQLASVQAEDWVAALEPNTTDYLFNPEEKLQEILDITIRDHEEDVDKIISESEKEISAMTSDTKEIDLTELSSILDGTAKLKKKLASGTEEEDKENPEEKAEVKEEAQEKLDADTEKSEVKATENSASETETEKTSTDETSSENKEKTSEEGQKN